MGVFDDPAVIFHLARAWILPAAAGIVLAAAAGLRAFLPLAAVSWAVRFEWLEPHEAFVWMGSTTAVVIFTVAVVVEIAGDKIPAIDHALDTIESFLKPLAGALLVAAPLIELDPLYGLVLGFVTGGALAGGIHILKAKGRLVGNFLTFGVAAPVLSLIEDAITLALVVLAILLPVMALVLAIALVVAVLAAGRQRPSRREVSA